MNEGTFLPHLVKSRVFPDAKLEVANSDMNFFISNIFALVMLLFLRK